MAKRHKKGRFARTNVAILQDLDAIDDSQASEQPSASRTPNTGETDLKTAKKVFPKRTMPALMRVFLAALFLILISIVFTWFLFWRQNLCNADAAWAFINEKPDLALYSYIVILLLVTLLAAVTWRVFFSAGFAFAALSVITYIHIQKYQLRSTPLLPEDFQLADSADSLIQFVDIWGIVRLVAGVIFILVGSGLLEYFTRKVFGRNRRALPWWERYSLVPRVTFSLMALATLVLLAGPIMHGEKVKWLEDLDLVAWDQTKNYENNGFLIGFLYNLGRLELIPPDGYSKERMDQIADKYRQIQREDTGRKPLNEVVDNVIVILDETFYDPEILTKYSHEGGDIVPNLHRIFRNYPGGYMYSPEYGGNTANVEFEVQTGLSNYWALTFPYVRVVPKLERLLSAANWAKEFGFETTAIHSYDGSVYKRNLVYPKLGYGTFIDEENFTHTEHEGQSEYISDRSLFREILDVLKENDGDQMVGAATMQNHSPYNGAAYPELEFALNPRQYWLESNFQSIHQADKYVGEFLDELDQLDERTVVLWFGDHAVGLLDEYFNSEEKNERDMAHITPYFIYANFDIESEYTVSEVAKENAKLGLKFNTKGIDLPTTTPNCLLNTMYDTLNVEKPALFYLVEQVCEETPVLARSYFGSEEPAMTEALTDYELVNYDVLGGKHYWNGN